MTYSEDHERVEAAIAGARKTSTGWYHVACFYCEDAGHRDKKHSLHVNAATGRYKCWRCGEWGRIEVLDGVGAPPAPAVDDPLPVFAPPDRFAALYGEDDLGFALEPARHYLRRRGVPEQAVRDLRMGAVPLGGRGCSCCPDRPRCRWAGRVVVPHLDADDGRTWRGWVARVWVKRPPPGVLPYLYPPGMKRTLYNARVLAEQSDEPALAVEGALDAAHFHDRAFAFFGSPTEAHVEEVLRRARRPVCVVLDGDAWAKGEMLALRLRFDGLRAGHVRLPPTLDPDDVDRGWLLEEARRSLG